MSLTSDALSEANRRGQSAFWHADPPTDQERDRLNPYGLGSAQALEWRAGWMLAAGEPDKKTNDVEQFVADLADAARARAQAASAASWALDSALSLYRKSNPATGYRNSEALGDAGTWDRVTYARRIVAAVEEASKGAGGPGITKRALLEIEAHYAGICAD